MVFQLPLAILLQTTIQVAAVACVLLLGVFATYFDLRERRIPNSLNLASVAAAFALTFMEGRLGFSYAAFVAAAFAFAYFLYKLGVWAGGDAKFFTALMSFFPIVTGKGGVVEPLLMVFLASAALTVPVMAFKYWRQLFSLRGEFRLLAAISMKPAFLGALTSTAIYFAYSILTIGFGASSLVGTMPLLASSFALSLAIVFAFSFLSKSFSVVSQKVLRVKVATQQLREGDIPAQSVYLEAGAPRYWRPPSPGELFSKIAKLDGGAFSGAFPPKNTVVSCLRARGLSLAEITKLKKLGVKHLVIKQSVPLAPALALGMWLVAWV